MTRVVYEPARLLLRMEGHAGAGPFGEDTVCAALSMLGMTLERRVSELAEHCFPSISRAPGSLLITCSPDEEGLGACRESFETVAAGLALLAAERPEYVRFLREEDDEDEEELEA